MKPTGYQSASTPSRRISPAMPRNDAADRYSPEIAPAFDAGPTVREATRKSEVLRATRTPSEPIMAEANATRAMAASAITAVVVTRPLSQAAQRRRPGQVGQWRQNGTRPAAARDQLSWTWSANSCSTASAVRVCHQPNPSRKG